MVEALFYKPEGRGFQSRLRHSMNLPLPDQTRYGPGFGLSLTEMSTSNPSGDKELPVRKANSLTAICMSRLSRQCWIIIISQSYRPLRHITGKTFLSHTQPLTGMITRNLPGGKGQQARKANLTAIC
jgi:hypothetical protein